MNTPSADLIAAKGLPDRFECLALATGSQADTVV